MNITSPVRTFTTEPVVIDSGMITLYGILRTCPGAQKLVIMVPAVTGTRTGPQRIYTQVAHELARQGMASCCVDLPMSGDSYDASSARELLDVKESPEWYRTVYFRYLPLMLDAFREKFKAENIYFLSISVGCLPVFHFARTKGLGGAILLSPNHFPGHTASINKKNLRTYRQKLFKRETWVKLVGLQLNWKRIFGNVYNKRKKAPLTPGNITAATVPVDLLVIFGERDTTLKECLSYWDVVNAQGKCRAFQVHTVFNADHSFFGWHFKEEVTAHIVAWMLNRKGL